MRHLLVGCTFGTTCPSPSRNASASTSGYLDLGIAHADIRAVKRRRSPPGQNSDRAGSCSSGVVATPAGAPAALAPFSADGRTTRGPSTRRSGLAGDPSSAASTTRPAPARSTTTRAHAAATPAACARSCRAFHTESRSSLVASASAPVGRQRDRPRATNTTTASQQQRRARRLQPRDHLRRQRVVEKLAERVVESAGAAARAGGSSCPAAAAPAQVDEPLDDVRHRDHDRVGQQQQHEARARRTAAAWRRSAGRTTGSGRAAAPAARPPRRPRPGPPATACSGSGDACACAGSPGVPAPGSAG